MNTHQSARLTPRGRALLVSRVLDAGEKPSQVAVAMGVSSRTVHKWVFRFRTEGEAGLQDQRSRPLPSPRRLKRHRAGQIVRLRRKRWSSPRIAREKVFRSRPW